MKLVACVLAPLALAACAQAPVLPKPAPPAPVAVAPADSKAAPAATTRTIKNAQIGFSLEVPQKAPLVLAHERRLHDRWLVAIAPDGTRLSVLFEHLPSKATEDACWDRLLKRFGPQEQGEQKSPDKRPVPKSVEELRTLARAGSDDGTQRSFLGLNPQGESCLVLLIEGPRNSEILSDVAPLALATFQATAPSPEFAAQLALEAGAQLLDHKEYAAALRQFETALGGGEPLAVRAHFGAGLSAYFLGAASATKAIEHLSKVVEARSDPERPAEEDIRSDEYRDALMYLGLSYASLKQFPQATNTLAELVDRYPDDPYGRYNFACVLALKGEDDAALDELRAAFRAKPDLTGDARKDDDLKSLRTLPAWKSLVGDSAPTSAAP